MRDFCEQTLKIFVAVQLVKIRQFARFPNAEVMEKIEGHLIPRGQCRFVFNCLNQAADEQIAENETAVDAADELQLCFRDRPAIRDDRQRLK